MAVTGPAQYAASAALLQILRVEPLLDPGQALDSFCLWLHGALSEILEVLTLQLLKKFCQPVEGQFANDV